MGKPLKRPVYALFVKIKISKKAKEQNEWRYRRITTRGWPGKKKD